MERLDDEDLATFVRRHFLRGNHIANDAANQHATKCRVQCQNLKGQNLELKLGRRGRSESSSPEYSRHRLCQRWWLRWANQREEMGSWLPCRGTSRSFRRRQRRLRQGR